MRQGAIPRDVIVALALMFAGGVTGGGLSLVTRAQVASPSDRSEYAWDPDPAEHYCVYTMSGPVGTECDSIVTTEICTVCPEPAECDPYVNERAKIVGLDCIVRLTLASSECASCDRNNQVFRIERTKKGGP